MSYKLVAFDMDGTLLKERTIFRLADEMGFRRKMERIINSEKPGYKKTIEIARFLKGLGIDEFLRIFRSIPLREDAEHVVKVLKREGIKTAIISNSYDVAVEDLRKRLGMDYGYANKLVIKNGYITGEVIPHNRNLSKRFPECRIHSICKRDVLRSLCKNLGIGREEAAAVGDGEVDICMLKEAGLGIAIGENEKVIKEADIWVENLMEILKYVIGGEEHGHQAGGSDNPS